MTALSMTASVPTSSKVLEQTNYISYNPQVTNSRLCHKKKHSEANLSMFTVTWLLITHTCSSSVTCPYKLWMVEYTLHLQKSCCSFVPCNVTESYIQMFPCLVFCLVSFYILCFYILKTCISQTFVCINLFFIIIALPLCYGGLC